MAIKYYAGNRLTGVSGDSKPTTLPTGSTFLETNTDDLYLWDGDSWNVVASNTGTEVLSNKSFSDSLVFEEISVPGNAANNKVRIYAKEGGRLYSKDDSGNEYDLTAGAGSASNMGGLTDTDISSLGSAHVLVYDGSNSWDNKAISGDVTIATTGATTLGTVSITGQTAETTPQGASDLILMYDNSASAFRKITVSNLLAGGVSADTLTALNDTTIASVASAQVLIYDGSDSWDNKTISGDVTINTSGVIAIASDVIVNADVKSDAAIAISKTALVAGTGITLATNTLNVDVAQTQITSVGALDAGSITSGFGTIDTGSSNITTTGTVSAGNLTVTGTTTTVNSTVMTVVDPIIHLQTASGGGALSSDTQKDVGLAMQYHTGSAAKTAFLGIDDNDSYKLMFIPDATLSSEVVSGTVGTIKANLEGTATSLGTARTISASGDITWTSASFDGSQNVTSVAAITADVIVNADVKSDAAIVDTKLATISTADKVAGGAIQIDSGTDGTGITIANADKFLVDDGGTTKYVNASQISTYIGASGEANESSFKTITVSGQSNVVADSDADTLTFAAGTGITLTTNASTDTVTITNSSTGSSESFAIAMAVAL